MTFNGLLKSIEVKLKSRESKNDIHKDLSVERRCVCGGQLEGQGASQMRNRYIFIAAGIEMFSVEVWS